MKKIKGIIDCVFKNKIKFLILVMGLFLLLLVAIPTLSRYRNKNVFPTLSVWDGSIATEYKSGDGSVEDPYLISNGSELAYFSAQLEENDNEGYEGKYFKLSNDIMLNKGIFKYDSELKSQYILDENTYYLDGYTGKYYEDEIEFDEEIGLVNIFKSLNGFKGFFDGSSFTIYGLYVADEEENELGLFTNLEGEIHNLYVDNAIIYGGLRTGGIVSTATNSVIKNVLFDGYVIGKEDVIEQTITISPSVEPIILDGNGNDVDLNGYYPFVGADIISSSLTGTYIINDNPSGIHEIKINDEEVETGSFNLNLGINKLNEITIVGSTDSTEDVTVDFIEFNYNVTYNYALTGGIVALAKNTEIENAINKGSVYGYSVSGGIVGASLNEINLNQVYNTGKINATNYSGGLVGAIEQSQDEDKVLIAKSYNIGQITSSNLGGLIGGIIDNQADVNINNVLDASETDYSIGTISNSNVSVSEFYYITGGIKTGTVTGTLGQVDSLDLTKDFFLTNLSYVEFVDYENLETNNDAVWVYEEDELPILYFDSIRNPIANIHVSLYSWNNFSTQLKSFHFFNNITFMIKDANELGSIKERYYYISDEVLTRTDLESIEDWVLYEDIVKLTGEGAYIIYAKIVDYDDNITYLNTDLLLLDIPEFTAKIKSDNNEWTTFNEELEEIYVGISQRLTVQLNEAIPLLYTINYYISNETLTVSKLDLIEDWIGYEDEIIVDQVGQNIVYLQVIDEYGNLIYLNTDIIVLDGYQVESVTAGRDVNSYLDVEPNITSNSSVRVNITSTGFVSDGLTNPSHNLLSNLLLPIGTKITLINNLNKKVYSYTTTDDNYNYDDSCDEEDLECLKVATYPFVNFKELGHTNKLFSETEITDFEEEDYTIILDFLKTEIEINHENNFLFLELYDGDKLIKPTLNDTIKEYNLYYDLDGVSLSLTTDYNGDGISYNSDSVTNINLLSSLNYGLIGTDKIIDTTYENMKIGLAIKMVDSNNKIVDKKYFKNFTFKVGDLSFYPGNDNIVRINLDNGLNDFEDKITITTMKTNQILEEGNYSFKITNYISNDGYYYNYLNNTEVTIPIIVDDDIYNIDYGFDVIRDNNEAIILKSEINKLVTFNILQYGELTNPKLIISLYEKDEVTPYNQDYTLVDLQTYVTDTLIQAWNKVYYISINPIDYTINQEYNPFSLNLELDKFDKISYKFVFELYDGNRKIGTINKYFIVK